MKYGEGNYGVYGVFRCPGQVSSDHSLSFQAYRHYSINTFISMLQTNASASNGWNSHRYYDKVKAPSRRALILEGNLTGTGNGASSVDNKTKIDFLRHGQRLSANVGMLDGHVESPLKVQVPDSCWAVPFWGQGIW